MQDAAFGIAHREADVLNAARLIAMPKAAVTRPAPGTLSALLGFGTAATPGHGLSAKSHSLNASGYVVLNAKHETRLVADVAGIGPAHVPAHGHAGIFTFEVSFQGRRVIVDSGVGTYEAGARRDYFRSTRAHNTVTVNDENQSDVWGSFRAGRRARVIALGSTRERGVQAFAGQHDGYERLRPGLIHTRIAVVMDEGAVVVIDRVASVGPFPVRSYVHFHPEVTLRQSDGDCFDVTPPHAPLRLWLLGRQTASSHKGQVDPLLAWYAPEFGSDRPNNTVVLNFDIENVVEGGFALLPAAWARPSVGWGFSERTCTVTFASDATTREVRVLLEPTGVR
jgi:uncharacterized heparinase superfamily protein